MLFRSKKGAASGKNGRARSRRRPCLRDACPNYVFFSPPVGRAFREWPRAQRAAQALGRLHIHSNPEPAVFWRATETTEPDKGSNAISRGRRLCRPSLRTGSRGFVKIADPRAPLRCALGHSLVARCRGSGLWKSRSRGQLDWTQQTWTGARRVACMVLNTLACPNCRSCG